MREPSRRRCRPRRRRSGKLLCRSCRAGGGVAAGSTAAARSDSLRPRHHRGQGTPSPGFPSIPQRKPPCAAGRRRRGDAGAAHVRRRRRRARWRWWRRLPRRRRRVVRARRRRRCARGGGARRLGGGGVASVAAPCARGPGARRQHLHAGGELAGGVERRGRGDGCCGASGGHGGDGHRPAVAVERRVEDGRWRRRPGGAGRQRGGDGAIGAAAAGGAGGGGAGGVGVAIAAVGVAVFAVEVAPGAVAAAGRRLRLAAAAVEEGARACREWMRRVAARSKSERPQTASEEGASGRRGKNICPHTESNCGPHPCEGCALPTEPCGRPSCTLAGSDTYKGAARDVRVFSAAMQLPHHDADRTDISARPSTSRGCGLQMAACGPAGRGRVAPSHPSPLIPAAVVIRLLPSLASVPL